MNIKFHYRHLAKNTVQYLVKISLNTTILIYRLLMYLYIQRQQKDVTDLQFRAFWFMTQNKCGLYYSLSIYCSLPNMKICFPSQFEKYQINSLNNMFTANNNRPGSMSTDVVLTSPSSLLRRLSGLILESTFIFKVSDRLQVATLISSEFNRINYPAAI